VNVYAQDAIRPGNDHLVHKTRPRSTGTGAALDVHNAVRGVDRLDEASKRDRLLDALLDQRRYHRVARVPHAAYAALSILGRVARLKRPRNCESRHKQQQ
jgi:hypothetical protein